MYTAATLITDETDTLRITDLADQLEKLAKEYTIGSETTDLVIVELMSKSLRSDSGKKVYTPLETPLNFLFIELANHIAALTNLSFGEKRKAESKVNHLAIKCLLLFRARMFFDVTELDESEKALLPYSMKLPDNLTDNDLLLWFTIETTITELKHQDLTKEIQLTASEAKETLRTIHEEREKFLDIAGSHTQKFSRMLDKHTQSIGDEFEDYKKQKKKEQYIAFICCFMSISGLLFFGNKAMISHYDLISKLIKNNKEITYTMILASNWVNIFVEFLLFYVFRITLQNYYAARDEALQLGLRETVCRFLPIYREFVKDKNCDFNDFSKLIFSPLSSRLGTTPKITDPITELASAISSFKNKNK
ncbi:hypothetical protein [Halodesulfovibrio sp.]|jgi:hypothetical protein|uniref:hypothetical protein n=1 Tax=Halodesulfovibrio sp. TaxID=1912772 RepID=UPI0025EFE681|nr:hypothetical protein [Halodesulfovibrio sp.]MCT4627906.1 hypothetical protein [Halodesulfovibrio sp.]